MTHTQHLLALALTTFALTACGGSDKSASPGAPSTSGPTPTPAAQLQALEASGELPKLDRSSSIKGPDTDNNGIRDDIDAWIAAQPITEAQKKAAQQMAKVQQAKLLVDLSNEAALQSLGDQSMRAVSCIVDSFEPEFQKGSEMRGQLESMMANTKERAKQYIAYNRARSGSVTELPSGNTCER